MPRGMNAPKLWPAEPLKSDADRVFRQAGGAVLARDLAAGDRADDAIHVADRQLRDDLLAALDRGLAEVEQLRDVERLLEAVILRDLAEAADVRAGIGLIQQVAEVEALRLPVIDRLARFEPVDAADHLLDACGSRAAP